MRIIAYLLILLFAIAMCVMIGSCSLPDRRGGLKPLPWKTPTRLEESNPPITEGWELIGEKADCKCYVKYYEYDFTGAIVFWTICNNGDGTSSSIAVK